MNSSISYYWCVERTGAIVDKWRRQWLFTIQFLSKWPHNVLVLNVLCTVRTYVRTVGGDCEYFRVSCELWVQSADRRQTYFVILEISELSSYCGLWTVHCNQHQRLFVLSIQYWFLQSREHVGIVTFRLRCRSGLLFSSLLLLMFFSWPLEHCNGNLRGRSNQWLVDLFKAGW